MAGKIRFTLLLCCFLLWTENPTCKSAPLKNAEERFSFSTKSDEKVSIATPQKQEPEYPFDAVMGEFTTNDDVKNTEVRTVTIVGMVVAPAVVILVMMALLAVFVKVIRRSEPNCAAVSKEKFAKNMFVKLRQTSRDSNSHSPKRPKSIDSQKSIISLSGSLATGRRSNINNRTNKPDVVQSPDSPPLQSLHVMMFRPSPTIAHPHGDKFPSNSTLDSKTSRSRINSNSTASSSGRTSKRKDGLIRRDICEVVEEQSILFGPIKSPVDDQILSDDEIYHVTPRSSLSNNSLQDETADNRGNAVKKDGSTQ